MNHGGRNAAAPILRAFGEELEVEAGAEVEGFEEEGEPFDGHGVIKPVGHGVDEDAGALRGQTEADFLPGGLVFECLPLQFEGFLAGRLQAFETGFAGTPEDGLAEETGSEAGAHGGGVAVLAGGADFGAAPPEIEGVISPGDFGGGHRGGVGKKRIGRKKLKKTQNDQAVFFSTNWQFSSS